MSAGVRVSLSAAQVQAAAGLVDSNHFPPPASAPAQGEAGGPDVTRVDSDGMGSAPVSRTAHDVRGANDPCVCGHTFRFHFLHGRGPVPCIPAGSHRCYCTGFTPTAVVAGWAT